MIRDCKLLLLLSILLAVSCVDKQPQEMIKKSFTAQMEGFDHPVKTSLGGKNSVIWSTGDCISIFEGSSRADQYLVCDYCAGSPNGEFYKGTSSNNGFLSGNELNTNIAVYPYSTEYACYGTGLSNGHDTYMVSGVILQKNQHYSHKSFPEESFVMMAVTDGTDDRNLKFKNVCGALKLSIKGTGEIKSITLKGNMDEPISGYARISCNYGGVPSYEFYDNIKTSITLDCGDGVDLDASVPTEFILTVPPVNFQNGFTVIVEDTTGDTEELRTSIPQEILRSTILVMPEIEVSLSKPEAINISEALNSSGIVTISGVVKAISTTGLILSDNTADIFVYYGSSFRGRFVIGDVLSISGYTEIYKNTYNFYPQTTSCDAYTSVEYGEARIIDEEFVEMQQAAEFNKNVLDCEYVEFEGYFLSGNYLRLDNSNMIITLSNLNADLNSLASQMQRCKVKIKGYTYALTSSTYPSIITTSVELIGNEERDLDITLGEYKASFTGTVTATCSRGYVLDNGEDCWYVYCRGNYPGYYNIGDIVTSTGLIQTFSYGREIFNVYDSLVGYNDTLTPGEPEIITAEKLDTYLASTDGFKPYKDYLLPTRLIQATGTLLKVSTEQYDLLIEGTENRLTIFSPEASTLESAASLVGQQVTLTGYIIKTANEHAVSVMQTSLGLFLSE